MIEERETKKWTPIKALGKAQRYVEDLMVPALGKDVIKEVGMSQEIKMYTNAINKHYDKYLDSVKDLQKYLIKKDAKKVSQEIGSKYVGHVGKFHHWMKTKFVRLIRKMI